MRSSARAAHRNIFLCFAMQSLPRNSRKKTAPLYSVHLLRPHLGHACLLDGQAKFFCCELCKGAPLPLRPACRAAGEVTHCKFSRGDGVSSRTSTAELQAREFRSQQLHLDSARKSDAPDPRVTRGRTGRALLLRGVTESCRAACKRCWSGATGTSRDGAYKTLDIMVPSMNQGDRALKNSA